MAVIFDENGVTPLLDEAGGQVLDEAGAPTLPSSIYPIGITTEILINGTWVDISKYIYQRDPIVIVAGQPDQGSKSQPSKITLTINNRDGRFSPNNTAGAYFPFLQRNVQLRVTATATSVTGNFYSGFRFWGEVHHWPPTSDLTGKDVFVPLTASGPLRKIHAGGGQGSDLTRYYASLSGSFAPIAYWPGEEDPSADVIGAGIDGGTTMSVTTGTPLWKAISDFNGSAPIGVLNNSTWDGLTGSFGSSGDDVYTVPGTYQWQASTTTVDLRLWGAGAGGGWMAGGAGGAGGFRRLATLAVTPGNFYTVTVGAGGSGGNSRSVNGAPGGNSSMSGDSATGLAGGGSGGNGSIGTGGNGGSGDFAGGKGGNGAAGGGSGGGYGGGGGGSGSTASAGNNGGNATSTTAGSGATAVTGGGAGGNGGIVAGGDPGHNGTAPGGGGGGGGGNLVFGGGNGAPGAPGKVELIYTPQTQPAANIVRFILLVPKHGGNNAKVLLRAKTTSAVIDHLDVTYVTGGKLRLQGFNASNVQQFDSTAQAWNLNGQTVMVSAELANSGANVAWTFKAVTPGSKTLLGSATGTVTAASCGNVSEVIAAPNADITKTAMGHISVQYALIDLLKVSDALNGHVTEMGVDRFLRLGNEEAMNNAVVFSETQDHWGFEDGTVQGWGSGGGSANCTLANSTAWSSEGMRSLLLTATGGGAMFAVAPASTSFTPINPGDLVSVHAELYAPTGAAQAYIGVKFFTSGSAPISEVDSTDTTLASGVAQTIKLGNVTAPATTAFWQPVVGDHATEANGTQLFMDNFRSHPRMGAQTRKELRKFLEEIADLDQGILYENKQLFGLKYKTRIRLINQQPAVTLDYSLAHLAAPLAPVFDDLLLKNHVIVHRHKGSKVTKTNTTDPKVGISKIGRRKRLHRVIAETDKQLDAIAEFLLILGTVADERYPVISVNLARTAVASIMSVLAGIEAGDYVKIINLASWFPSATTKQLVIGYTETLSPFLWTIDWNCQPENPWEVTAVNFRRW